MPYLFKGKSNVNESNTFGKEITCRIHLWPQNVLLKLHFDHKKYFVASNLLIEVRRKKVEKVQFYFKDLGEHFCVTIFQKEQAQFKKLKKHHHHTGRGACLSMMFSNFWHKGSLCCEDPPCS